MARPSLSPAQAAEREASAHRLKLAIQQLGGRTKVAALTDRSPAAVSLWGAGTTEPDSFTLRTLSRATGYSIDYLLAVDATAPDARPLEERVAALEVATGDNTAQLNEHNARLETLEVLSARSSLAAAVAPETVSHERVGPKQARRSS